MNALPKEVGCLADKGAQGMAAVLIAGRDDLDDGDDPPVPVLDPEAVRPSGIGVFLHLVHKPRPRRSRGHSQTLSWCACPWILRLPMKSQDVWDRTADLLTGEGDVSG